MKIANILSIILGLVLLILSSQWIFFPESASESLNMIYLDGEGRNTQIRDFSALFWTTSMLCFMSLVTKSYQWILSTGILFLSAGLCVLGESIIKKINEQNWFLVGTIALILINAGICLMIALKTTKNERSKF